MDVDIVIQSEDGTRHVRRLGTQGVISVGRNPRSGLYLESDLVSRQHILVDVFEHGLRVEDTSTNGTLAGATLLRRSAADVPFGTPIVVGNYTLVFQPADESADIPPSNPTVTSLEGMGPPTLMGQGLLPAETPWAPEVASELPPPPARAAVVTSPSQWPPRVTASPSRRPPPPESEVVVAAQTVSPAEADAETNLRRELHRLLAEQVGPGAIDPARAGEPALRLELIAALKRLARGFEGRLPQRVDVETLAAELADEALGLGPLDDLLNDPLVEEILVVDPLTVYVERDGRRERVGARFTDEAKLLEVLARLVAPAGVSIDGRSPFVEARLGGVHVHAALRPLSARGPSVTLRKAARAAPSLDRLARSGSLDAAVARFLAHGVAARKNILVSGGQGSGKTALLGALAGAIGPDERVVTVEDFGELRLRHPHLVSLVAAPAETPGSGWTARALLHQALRMRPDRIVLGACVGDEAFELLRGMHAGCDGSMTTVYAHSPREALTRFEALVRSGSAAPAGASLREDLASALHLVVQLTRFHDGSRRVSTVSEVVGIDPETGDVRLCDIFRFERTGADTTGRVVGSFRPTGHLPTFLPALVEQGLVEPGGPYL